jgi:hypothetical protein
MAKTQTQELSEAVQLYLDLMYDCDVGKFDRVFASTSQLHGFREGAPREEQLLLLDTASPTQALAKVRVRINDMVFVDYLSYHKVNGDWLITSKAYHREV